MIILISGFFVKAVIFIDVHDCGEEDGAQDAISDGLGGDNTSDRNTLQYIKFFSLTEADLTS